MENKEQAVFSRVSAVPFCIPCKYKYLAIFPSPPHLLLFGFCSHCSCPHGSAVVPHGGLIHIPVCSWCCLLSHMYIRWNVCSHILDLFDFIICLFSTQLQQGSLLWKEGIIRYVFCKYFLPVYVYFHPLTMFFKHKDFKLVWKLTCVWIIWGPYLRNP